MRSAYNWVFRGNNEEFSNNIAFDEGVYWQKRVLLCIESNAACWP